MKDNSIARYTIEFSSNERLELLEIFKDNPKWKNRVENSPGFLIGNLSGLIPQSEFRGCADSGFCFNCRIIVGNPTCFCMGGKCPKCGEHVNARSIPENLNGTYEKHSQGLNMVKMTYENGKLKL